ncbi:Uncharacterised protein [uncultured archaeon]|nr:Uncharacterised protein [uncultured archaeon]
MTSENLLSMSTSSIMPVIILPFLSRLALKYLTYGFSRPSWQTARVLKCSSTAPSAVSRAEWEAIMPMRRSPSSYSFRISLILLRSIKLKHPKIITSVHSISILTYQGDC